MVTEPVKKGGVLFELVQIPLGVGGAKPCATIGTVLYGTKQKGVCHERHGMSRKFGGLPRTFIFKEPLLLETANHDPRDAATDTRNLGTVERMLWHAGQGGGHTAGHMRNVSEEGDAVRLLHRPRGS